MVVRLRAPVERRAVPRFAAGLADALRELFEALFDAADLRFVPVDLRAVLVLRAPPDEDLVAPELRPELEAFCREES